MTFEQYTTVGIGSDEVKLKLAAILFDKVYNVDKTIEVPRALLTKIPVKTDSFKEIAEDLKERLDTNYTNLLVNKLLPNYFESRAKISKNEVIEIIEQTIKETKAKVTNLFAIDVARQLTVQKTIGIPLFNETLLYDHLERDYFNDYTQEKVEIKMINAPIIVANDLEWAQIVEAKKDRDFNMKVRRFSLFINKNYAGRDLHYIIDDLSIQIEEYKEACNKHGIKLREETIKTLANSKTYFGTLGLAFCALLARMPEYTLVTTAVGTVLEIVNIYISIKQYEDKFESFLKDSPISLFFELDKMNNRNILNC
jgi:hypothetical protein